MGDPDDDDDGVPLPSSAHLPTRNEPQQQPRGAGRGSRGRGRAGRGRGRGAGEGEGGEGPGAGRGRGRGGRGTGQQQQQQQPAAQGGGGRGRGRGRGGQGPGAGAGAGAAGSSAAASSTAAVVEGWDVYFQEESAKDDDKARFVLFLAEQIKPYVSTQLIGDNNVVPFMYEELIEHISDPSFPRLVYEDPETALACLACSLHQIVYGNQNQPSGSQMDDELAPPPPQRKFTVRLFKYSKITPLRKLKANFLGKFVCVKGTVVRTGNIRPMVKEHPFLCVKCSTQVYVQFRDGRYETPKVQCSGCNSRTWKPLHSGASLIDWQVIRVQEQVDDKSSGRIPRIIDCELKEDLVDSCVPGDEVVVCGIVKAGSVEPVDEKSARFTDKKKAIFDAYIEVNSVDKNHDDHKEQMEFSQKDLQLIVAIHETQNLFNLLVNSLCPGIFGHDLVKAGLLLALLGGCQKYSKNRNKLPIRGDPHVLIVGDPGLGKSQLLNAVNLVSPRGVFVCGTYASSAGLTVALHKQPGSPDYALEAGALVMADQGCCCIDEFDKMPKNEPESLLEAMEQQSISIAKAGIVCSLPSRTTVITAANPIGGRYNKGKKLSENLSMSAALLSRFDLIFVLLDNPDEVKDKLLADHVMELHSGLSQKRPRLSLPGSQQWDSSYSDLPLESRLHKPDDFEPLLQHMLRKYIAYVRKYSHPRLSPEAGAVLSAFYKEMRTTHRNDEVMPVTPRLLEALIRLTEARAKVEMKPEASVSDAQDAISIMKGSLQQIFTQGGDATFVDFRLANTGKRLGKAKQISVMRQVLRRESQRTNTNSFTTKELRALASQNGIAAEDCQSLIDTLNNNGILLFKAGKYEFHFNGV
ncbi:DNA helicase MCM8 [Pelomyxa schiedti]|nr:DNA helicase MCM8 [Pelomyxa schiedti]